MPNVSARRHLAAVPAPAAASEREMPWTEAEMEDAMGYLLARMVPLRQRTGWEIEEIIESDIFGMLALACVAALRTNPPLPRPARPRSSTRSRSPSTSACSPAPPRALATSPT